MKNSILLLILLFTFGQSSCCEEENDKILYVKSVEMGTIHYSITDGSHRNLGVTATFSWNKYIGSTITVSGQMLSLEGQEAQQLFEDLKTSYEHQEAAKLKDEG